MNNPVDKRRKEIVNVYDRFPLWDLSGARTNDIERDNTMRLTVTRTRIERLFDLLI